MPGTRRPRVVVLGSGWGAVSFIKGLPQHAARAYDVVVLSPRNYFVYTPLLPAVATGTVEERSIVESIRTIVAGKARYYEAQAQRVDAARREVVACSAQEGARYPDARFRVPYDHLVVAVGSVANTLGAPGVAEHCVTLKGVHDAARLRARMSECFERAALPFTDAEVRAR